MSIRIEAYTASGVARGLVARDGHLREVLEAGGDLRIERASWQPHGQPAASPAGEITLTVDDIIVAVGDDEPSIPVHASWHRLGVEAPPFALTGELPTLPGYDPGRALARPTGEFVVLRDVVLAVEGASEAVVADVALLNRYAVERVEADLMLGFYFPGAALAEADLAGA